MTVAASLRDVVSRMHNAGISLHTIDVSVGRRLVTSTAIAPFGREVPHRFYSVAKSLTAIAILLLEHRGRLSLDDPIAQHFPEFADVHPWVAATRIDDMLAMSGPHARTTFDGDDWLASYFRVAPSQRPGTLFTYDTSASYVLSALVERLSGSSLLDALRADLLTPLGIGSTTRMLTGPDGFGHGGSGLIAPPADLLAIAETINARGRSNGRQVLPEAVVDRLLEPRSDTAMLPWHGGFHSGYGRHIWLPGRGAWLMFGLGGQLVYGDPARELAAVVTADTTRLASGDQWFAEELIAALTAAEFETETASETDDVALIAPAPPHLDDHARPIEGDWDLVGGDGAPERVSVTADATGGRVRWDTGPAVRFTPGRAVTASSLLGDARITAGWSAPGILDIRLNASGDDIATVCLRAVLSPRGELTLQCEAFGPASSWSWRGTYRPASV